MTSRPGLPRRRRAVPTLNLRIVNCSRCHTRKSSRATPPQRIILLLTVARAASWRRSASCAAPRAGSTGRTPPRRGPTSASDEHDAEEPQEAAERQDRREHRAQVLGVLVERLDAGEDLEVAVHVQRARRTTNSAPDTAMSIFMKTVVRRADAGRFDPVTGRVLVATEEPYPRGSAGSGGYRAGRRRV